MAPFGYVATRRVRPVETNTVYHVRPGTLALTIGMYGCDLRCPYCQNWRLSQAPREDTKAPPPTVVQEIDRRAVAEFNLPPREPSAE
jgi:pyruvate formate lyase activating enzyme